jgi:hypothetical protein
MMARMIVNTELELMWKLLFRRLSGGTEEHHEYISGWLVSQPKLEPDIFRMQERRVTGWDNLLGNTNGEERWMEEAIHSFP